MVNDEDTKRASASQDYDAYRVFLKMLEGGHPPDDWSQLLEEARSTINIREAIPKPVPGFSHVERELTEKKL